SPPSATSNTYIWLTSSPSRRAANAIRRLSALHATPLSPPFVDVSRRGFALPSVGTIHRSDTWSFSSYAGSTRENTTHFPSGLGTGAPTRFIIHIVSCVNGALVCALTNSHVAEIRTMMVSARNENR